MRKSQTAKTTIKNDPWAAVIPAPEDLDAFEPVEAVRAPEPAVAVTKAPRVARATTTDQRDSSEDEAKAGKRKLTVHLASELADRVKNAAYWNPRLTIASIAEQGIKFAIEKHERENGGKYPPREGELVGGRPIK
jgi:hypothetical protein